jgi:hypothetical protein
MYLHTPDDPYSHDGQPSLQKVRNALLRTLGSLPAVRKTMAMNLSELATDRRRGGDK